MNIGLNKNPLRCRNARLSVMVSCYEAGHADVGRMTFRNTLIQEIRAMFGVHGKVRIGLRRW